MRFFEEFPLDSRFSRAEPAPVTCLLVALHLGGYSNFVAPQDMAAGLLGSLVLIVLCGLTEALVSSQLRRQSVSTKLRESSDWERYYQDKHRATKVLLLHAPLGPTLVYSSRSSPPQAWRDWPETSSTQTPQGSCFTLPRYTPTVRAGFPQEGRLENMFAYVAAVAT